MGLETFLDKCWINRYTTVIGVMGMTGLVNETVKCSEGAHSPLALGFSIFNVIGPIFITYWQTKNYTFLVGALEEHGYNEKFIRPYMKNFMGRTVAEAALKRTGHAEQYDELRKKFMK